MKHIILTLTLIITLFYSHPSTANTGFSEIRDTLNAYKSEKKGATTAQKSEIDRKRKEYIKSLEGQTVQWRGWVDDVKGYDSWLTGTGYTVEVDMDSPSKWFSLSDVSFETTDNSVADLIADTPIIINGTIKSVNSAGKITLVLHIIKQGHDQAITTEELQAAQREQKAAKQEQKTKLDAQKAKGYQIENQGAQAYIACKTVIPQKLVSPHTAKFPWLGGWDYRVLPDNKTATIHSYVDSQNQFGAMVRTNFECRLRYIGDGKWSVEETVL